jgi:hypothetical protein
VVDGRHAPCNRSANPAQTLWKADIQTATSGRKTRWRSGELAPASIQPVVISWFVSRVDPFSLHVASLQARYLNKRDLSKLLSRTVPPCR